MEREPFEDQANRHSDQHQGHNECMRCRLQKKVRKRSLDMNLLELALFLWCSTNLLDGDAEALTV